MGSFPKCILDQACSSFGAPLSGDCTCLQGRTFISQESWLLPMCVCDFTCAAVACVRADWYSRTGPIPGAAPFPLGAPGAAPPPAAGPAGSGSQQQLCEAWQPFFHSFCQAWLAPVSSLLWVVLTYRSCYGACTTTLLLEQSWSQAEFQLGWKFLCLKAGCVKWHWCHCCIFCGGKNVSSVSLSVVAAKPNYWWAPQRVIQNQLGKRGWQG